MRLSKLAAALFFALLAGTPATAVGPLRVHPENPRYFTDDTGRAIYLTGSHTWTNVQDIQGAAEPFDFDAYLDFLREHNHNFTRLWAWESPVWVRPDSRVLQFAPLPYLRTGPGEAFGGRPRFDLTVFDESYFARLRERVSAARKRGVIVAVMLFQGFSVSRKDKRRLATPWLAHPFRNGNNVNGIDPDRDGDGEGYEIHTLADPEVTRLQEAYLRRVIGAVNDFDNVIYEISNESHGASTDWQYHMIRYLREQEAGRPVRHPVWMSYQWDGIAGPGNDAVLFEGPADAVSPRGAQHEYRSDPPVAGGAKIVIADTDHLWGIGGDRAWAWKSFLRGLHPVFMDPYRGCKGCPVQETGLDPQWEPVRRAMGDTLRFASRLDLAKMTPTGDPAACSTRYSMRRPGVAYLAYQPASGPFTLAVEEGTYRIEWFKASTSDTVPAAPKRLEHSSHTFRAPFEGDAVLLLTRDE